MIINRKQVFSQEILSAHPNFTVNDFFELTEGEIYLKEQVSISIDKRINYKLNNYGHRCDDFNSPSKILYAGCSATFGESLPYKENWAGRLHKKIGENTEFHTLGYLNGNISYIINNMFKYFKNVGNPEVIFCCFPDAARRIISVGKQFTFEMSRTPDSLNEHQMLSMYSLLALESYCRTSNIKLFWTSWQHSDLKFFSTLGFKNLVFDDIADVYLHAKNDDEKDDPLYEMGMDKVHPGFRYSDGLANILYREYIK